MNNFILIFVSLGLGFFFKKSKRFPSATPAALNSFVICISLPAIILLQIPKLIKTTTLSLDLLIPISMAWILFFLSWLLFTYLGKRRNWSRARTGALILTAGLGNTSFVGLPLLEALHGQQALSWGLLIDQLGSFLTLSTLGLLVASNYGNPKDGKRRSTLVQILRFPPFIALALASVIGLLGPDYPIVVRDVLLRLGDTLVPIALIAVGFQLKLSRSILVRYWKPLGFGMLFKLVLAPLALLGLYYFASGELSFVTRITILEAAMATMITSAVVASDFGLDEELANLMVGVSIPISLITVPAWDYLLGLI